MKVQKRSLDFPRGVVEFMNYEAPQHPPPFEQAQKLHLPQGRTGDKANLNPIRGGFKNLESSSE